MQKVLLKASLLLVVIIACMLLWDNLSWSHHKSNSPVMQRNRNLFRIGYALQRYRDDHSGNLPDRLSALVPSYLATSDANIFYWPPEAHNWSDGALGVQQIQRKIDVDGAFIYLGQKGLAEDIVLYDRRDLWPPRTNEAGVATLRASNLLPKLRSPEAVEDKLRRIR